MRKLLLASVATLGTGALFGAAIAQTPAGAPSQGQVAYPAANPLAGANDNNNYQAAALPGVLANPTPGTIVIHINGKVQTEFQGQWTSVDSRLTTSGLTAPTGTSFPVGVNGTGYPVKLQPLTVNAFAREYFGADGMATNGLRYGAAIELRQNFIGTRSFNDQSGASGMSSASTVYVRRAFTYVAGESWGIVRAGMADGIIGIFDNGVTTGQFTLIGELNGGDTQNLPTNVAPTFFFLSQAGNEYDVTKLVYLSPQIAGFDFGLQYAPNVTNGFAVSTGNPFNGTLSNGTGIGCSVANSGCANMSSGPGANDGSHFQNWTAVGARYQGTFSGVGLLAYAAYEFSGHTHYTGPSVFNVSPTTGAVTVNSLGTTNLGVTSLVTGTGATAVYHGRYDGSYQGLSFGSGGLALTYAGFTLAGNIIGGAINGQLGLVPNGGSNEVAYTLSLKYVTGPFTIGAVAETGWFQGNPALAGLSQRRGRALAVGAQYTVAPGFQVAVEYGYNEQKQSLQNMLTGAIGTDASNSVHGQSFVLGSVVNF